VADIFHEVDEEVRREQLKKLWDRYSIYIVAVALLIIAGVGGWRGYQYVEAKKAAEAGVAFNRAVELSEQNKHEEAEKAFADLASKAPYGYRLLSRFHTAAEVANRDPKAAAKMFDDLAADSSIGGEQQELARIRAAGLLVDAADEKTLGLYQRQGRLRAIYVLYGLPKLLFRTVVAHEYAHAWQGESCPLLEDDRLREGFAEWVAYRHLLYLGCSKEAQRMLTSAHPYRPMLEEVLAIDARVGPSGVVQHLLAVGRGARPVI